MNPSIWQLKNEMGDIGRRIWQRGYCAGNEGNHSVRIGPDRILCTPTGVSKGFLSPEDIITVDMTGKQVEHNARGRRPTSEIRIHLAIYRHRPDIQAVVHSHPPHATAFAVTGMPVPEGIHPEAEVFLGKVKTVPYALPSTDALAQGLLPFIQSDTNTLLMGNHGSVHFAATLLDAYYLLEILDSYCRLLLLTRSLAKPNVLSDRQMVELLTIKQRGGLEDQRLACAASGCVGRDNASFLANFDIRPASATCSCNGGEVTDRRTQASPADDAALSRTEFESMVQAVTDQIMAVAGRQ